MKIAELLNEHELLISVGVLICMLVAFSRDVLEPSGVAVIGAAAYLLLGFVDTEEMLSVFANAAVVTIGAMLVLTAALVRTGTLEALAGRLIQLASSQPRLAMLVLMGIALIASAFLNSTPVVVILIPLIATLAQTIGVSARKLLIPLSYIAILGGTCTLIGTSTNLLVNSIARQHGHPGFGIFTITPIGVCAAVSGIVFLLLVARFLLPDKESTGDASASDDPVDIITECTINGKFGELDKSYASLALLKPRGVRLVSAERAGQRLDTKDDTVAATSGDRLVLRVTPAELATLQADNGLSLGLRLRRKADDVEHKTLRFTVVYGSPLAGKRLTNSPFLARYPVSLTGVRRHRVLAGPDLASLTVKPGDLFWVEGPIDALDQMAEDPYLVASQASVAKPFRRDRSAVAIVTLTAVVAVAAMGWMSLPIAAIIGIGFLLLVGSLDTGDAWKALSAETLILIYAMLIIGIGLQNTGAVSAIIDTVLPTLDKLPLPGVIIAVYFLTSVLTETVTNNGVAVIMTPIAMGLANKLGIEPTALIVCVMFAASASFATPIGYQTNTLVHIAGNYRFAEFLRIGIPMNIVVGLITSLVIAALYG